MDAWCSTRGAVESCRLTGLAFFGDDPMFMTAAFTVLKTGKLLTTNGESVPDETSRVVGTSLGLGEGSSICRRGYSFLLFGCWSGTAGTSYWTRLASHPSGPGRWTISCLKEKKMKSITRIKKTTKLDTHYHSMIMLLLLGSKSKVSSKHD